MDAKVLLQLATNDDKANGGGGPIHEDYLTNPEIWGHLYNKQTLSSVKQEIDQTIDASVSEIIKSLTNLDHSSNNFSASSLEYDELIEKQTLAKAKMTALNDVWTIRSGFQEARSCVDLGEFRSAFASIAKLELRIDAWAAMHPNTALSKQFRKEVEVLLELATEKFQDAWNNAIVFTDLDETTTVLAISEEVDGVSLKELYATLQILDADVYYSNRRKVKLLHLFEKKILSPALGLKVANATVVDNELTLALKNPLQEEEISIEEAISILTKIVDYLQQMLESSQLNIDIYKQFSSLIMNQLVRTVLPSYFPDSSMDLPDYKTKVQCAKDFEDRLTQIGWVKSTEIERWLSRLDDEWIAYRKTHYLDIVRTDMEGKVGKLMSINIQRPVPTAQPETGTNELQQVQEKEEANDEWGWNEEDEDLDGLQESKADDNIDENIDENWGWGDNEEDQDDQKESAQAKSSPAPQKAQISPINDLEMVAMGKKTVTLVVDWLIDVTSQFLFEIEDAGKTECRSQISEIINLYRVLALEAYQAAPSPIIMYNDFLLLHERLEQSIFHDIISGDLILLKRQAQSILNLVLNPLMQEIDTIIDGADGFVDCARNRNGPACNTAVSDCVELISKSFGSWQQYLPLYQVNEITALLIEKTITRIIEDVEAIVEIGEDESVELAKCLEQVSKLELLFPVEGDAAVTTNVALYVPSWIKFQYFIEIIQSTLADIKYLYRENSLVDFEQNELVNLIDALFASSDNRERLKGEILE